MSAVQAKDGAYQGGTSGIADAAYSSFLQGHGQVTVRDDRRLRSTCHVLARKAFSAGEEGKQA